MPTEASPHDVSSRQDVDIARMAGWPGPAVLVVIALVYLLLSEQRTFGPTWLAPLVLGSAVAAALLAEHQSAHRARRWLVLGANAVVTASLVVGTVLLVSGLRSPDDQPVGLLRDALLLWIINILTFTVWFWELDNGGPRQRSPMRYRSVDFLFPQKQLDPAGAWMPGIMDYVFLAFNTNTAFSPTDTLILSRPAKLCMMVQSSIALVDVAVFLARAVNSLQL